ncbi:hypothetical protein F5141DRAFT_1106239 [Pisolithus sp. B1]|nr:hypothetical protein F5141DRAFT_1106239 [Pisolithus sp. B1]
MTFEFAIVNEQPRGCTPSSFRPCRIRCRRILCRTPAMSPSGHTSRRSPALRKARCQIARNTICRQLNRLKYTATSYFRASCYGMSSTLYNVAVDSRCDDDHRFYYGARASICSWRCSNKYRPNTSTSQLVVTGSNGYGGSDSENIKGQRPPSSRRVETPIQTKLQPTSLPTGSWHSGSGENIHALTASFVCTLVISRSRRGSHVNHLIKRNAEQLIVNHRCLRWRARHHITVASRAGTLYISAWYGCHGA